MHRSLAIVLVLIAGLAGTTRVHALEYCVSTIDELRMQLSTLQVDAGDHTLKLEQGSYDLRPNGLSYSPSHSGSLSLLGGYTAGCAAREVKPDNTQLDGFDEYNTRVTLILPGGGLIEGMQFERLNSPASQGAIHIQCGNDGQSRTFVFRHNIVSATGGGPAFHAFDWRGEMRIENNLFGQNIGQGFNGLSVLASTYSTGAYSAQLVFAHNTVAANAGPTYIVADGGPSPNIAFQNNVLWANAGGDLRVSPGMILASDRNVIGSVVGGGSLALGSLWTPADPAFVNPAQGDFRLGAGSSAIDYGSHDVVGGLWPQDLNGHARQIGLRPDAGAYETSDVIFANGFGE